MSMYKIAYLSCTLAFTLSPALAADIELPASAKRQTGAEITQILSGQKTTWKNRDGIYGTAEYSADLKTSTGTLVNSEGATVKWESKVTIRKDQYCFAVRVGDSKKRFPRECFDVYADGKSLYEVNPKTKKVQSVNTVQ